MPSKLPLTLACGDYEIIRALKEGTVEPDGIDLTILTDMDSSTRHWRFIRNRDFDVAETSCSSYIVARDQGVPVNALPASLWRNFSSSRSSRSTIRTSASMAGARAQATARQYHTTS